MCLDKMLKEKYLRLLDGMKPGRLEHTVGVARTAVEMALRFGADPAKAEAAALLHDIAKKLPHTELKAEAQRLGIAAKGMYAAPALLHSAVGAELAREQAGVTDSDILNAIRWHTTGRAGMSALEKIIYVADMIEETRSYPGVEKLRAYAREDIDIALFKSVAHVIEYIAGRGDPLAVESVELYNSLVEHLGGSNG